MGRPSRTVVVAIATLGVVAVTAIRAAAENLVPFARCLTHAGATYFRASWCPHCAEQERMFGPARAYLGEIDCSRPGSCGREIESFPTWTFRNGEHVSGVLSLGELARRTGCPLAQARPARPPDDDAPTVHSLGGVKTHEHTVGGARVIEIP